MRHIPLLAFAFLIFACSAAASLNEIQAEIDKDISIGLRPGNEPFFAGNESAKSAVLLMHGFTASPWEVKELAEHLASKGFFVYSPLLPGHGTSPETLKDIKWEEWHSKANSSLALLNKDFNCVFAAGMSAGAALSLMLAENEDLCGVISIGAPIFFQDWRVKFAWLGKYFVEYSEKEIEESIEPYYYSRRPTAAAAELASMVSLMKKSLSEIDEPAIIIQSMEDATVKPESADYIFNKISSSSKELVWVEKGSHVLIAGEQKDEIFAVVENFIEQTSSQR